MENQHSQTTETDSITFLTMGSRLTVQVANLTKPRNLLYVAVEPIKNECTLRVYLHVLT